MTLIDRDKLIMCLADYQLQEFPNRGPNGRRNTDSYEAITACIEAIENMRTVNAEPVRYGRWLEDNILAEYCSECGKYPYDNGEYRIVNWHSNYCPHCGCKMNGEQND